MCDEKVFVDRRGRQIRLVMGNLDESCTAFFGEKEIGRFEFNEYDSDRFDRTVLLVTYCFLTDEPGFTRSGIGRAIIEFVRERGYGVVMRHHDGQRRDDGSHLTETAPGFADALEREGLIGRL